MELEALNGYVNPYDVYILEPNKDWKKDFQFWINLYIVNKCKTASKRLVNDVHFDEVNNIIKTIPTVENMSKLSEQVNLLERMKLKAPQVYCTNLICLYNALEELKATTLKNITQKLLYYIFRDKLNHLAITTKKNRLTILVNFIEFIEMSNVGDNGEGAHLFNINRKILGKEIGKKTERMIVLSPDEEYTKFLIGIEETKFSNGDARNKLMLKILLLTGMRISELTELRNKDVEIIKESKSTYLNFNVIGKGNKERTLKIAFKEIKNSLSKYNKEKKLTGENEFYFQTDNSDQMYREYVSRQIKKVLVNTNISLSKFGPHTLRHSYACYMYYSVNIQLEELKNLLGHEDIKTTQVYLHYFEGLTKKSAEKVSKSINQDKRKVKKIK